MPESTKQNKPEQPGGRPPEGVRRVAALPMGAAGDLARSAHTKGASR
jgi:hypothetical protein